MFEQLKLLPKVDLHINLTSSISTELVFDLTNETSIIDLEEKMFQHNPKEYLQVSQTQLPFNSPSILFNSLWTQPSES